MRGGMTSRKHSFVSRDAFRSQQHLNRQMVTEGLHITAGTRSLPKPPKELNVRAKRKMYSLARPLLGSIAGAASRFRVLRRSLHLAPPFLLDDYIPRYQTLASRDAALKRSAAYAHLRECNLCPRNCGVNRFEKTGTCLIGADVKVNVIAPHFGEGKL